MSKRLVIAGAGGFGRGLYGWLTSSPRYCSEHEIDEIVFVDDESPRWPLPAPVVGSVEGFRPTPGDEVLCAIGSPRVRQEVVVRLQEAGARFHTYVDPRAVLGSGVRVGAGSIICPGTVASAEVVIGDQVHVNFNCCLGHDTALMDFATLSPAANIMGEVVLGRGVFIGGGAVVLPRLSVGADAVVGAGAVVTKSVPGGVTVVGNPARVQPRRIG